MSIIEDTIKERTKTCGKFRAITQTAYDLKFTLRQGDKFTRMPPYMWEGLEMIAHKMARIVQGDPFYIDHWRDIQGYARLIEQELLENRGFEEKINGTLTKTEKGHLDK